MDTTAHRNSALLLLAFVVALVLAFGGLVADVTADAFSDVDLTPTTEVSP